MDKEKQPGINFDGIFIIKEKFSREPNVPIESEENLKMSSEIAIQGNFATVMIKTKFALEYDNQEVFKLSFRHIGKFSINEKNENMKLQEFVENNSVALMFPYIREHITSVTQKAGIQPIVIPPVNIRALLNK